MKKVYKDRIINIENTNIFDNKFVFDYLETDFASNDIEVFYMSELLKDIENREVLDIMGNRYSMYQNVYPASLELEIFEGLFNDAITNNKKTHIVGITMGSEVEILERYYHSLGFFDEITNTYKVDFSKVLVSVSVNIENLIWRGSDYKSMGREIFFNPPIRGAGDTKAMFKGINRGVISYINIAKLSRDKLDFLQDCIVSEYIMPLTLARVLRFNIEDFGFGGEMGEVEVGY